MGSCRSNNSANIAAVCCRMMTMMMETSPHGMKASLVSEACFSCCLHSLHACDDSNICFESSWVPGTPWLLKLGTAAC